MPFLAGFITPQDYGAVGNGTTDDTAALQASINAAFVTGATLFLPAAVYAVTPVSSTSAALTLNNGTTGYSSVRIVGAATGTTPSSATIGACIRKLANGPIFALAGPATDTTGNTHCKYVDIENVELDGNTFTGTMIQCYYADNLNFTNVRFINNYDIVIDSAEWWDSRFFNCVWENSGSLTNSASTPNVLLRNSAATSGFGFSTDNVNQIHFVGCRWEAFRQGALWIQQGVSSTNNPNGIFLVNNKMESSVIRGGPHLSVDSSSRGVYVDNLYCYSGGFGGTYTTPTDVISWSANGASTLENVFIANRTTPATVANGVTVNSAVASQAAVVRNVVGLYNSAPTGAHINFGTSTGAFAISNCNSTLGTQFTNPPLGYLANPPITQSAGAISDGVFGTTPLDGVIGLDTLNHRFYTRMGAVWNFMPIKTVSSGFGATTTIANTAALSTLQTVNVPGNDPQTNAVYRGEGYGIYSTTGTPTMTFALYWGGTGGTLLASIPAITAPSGVTNVPFSYEIQVTFRGTTSCVGMITLVFGTSAATDIATSYVALPTAATTVTTTSTQALAVGFTWGTASASNTISLLGGYIEKIR